MQDRYVGDLGDYGKYALLRHLAGFSGRPQLFLGIIWYLFPDEYHNNDGKHVSYLKTGSHRKLDHQLHGKLLELVQSGKRSVADVMQSGVFAPPTVFVYDTVEPGNWQGKPITKSRRIEYRGNWHREALARTEDCDIVFMDPDNGLEVKSVPFGSPKSGKYAYWGELREFFYREQSLVIYHHTNRRSSVAQQVRALARLFREELGEATTLIPLIYHRGSCRIFWLVLFEPMRNLVRERLDAFLATGWSEHFEIGEI